MEIKRQNNRGRCDLEDLKEEYTAYMKTKTYMAKRILEQQEDIEKLKEMFLYQNIRNTQMYEMVKQINSKISKKDDMNLSHDLVNSIILEDKKDDEFVEIEKPEDKMIKEENIELRKLSTNILKPQDSLVSFWRLM